MHETGVPGARPWPGMRGFRAHARWTRLVPRVWALLRSLQWLGVEPLERTRSWLPGGQPAQHAPCGNTRRTPQARIPALRPAVVAGRTWYLALATVW